MRIVNCDLNIEEYRRVLDELISIKAIIEEEYDKANLSIEETRIMPLPIQIGI